MEPVLPEIRFSPVSEKDGEEIIDLFNYYIEHSFAAFPEQKVPQEFFSCFFETCRHYPSVVARLPDGTLAGFGLLRAHNPMPAFRHTAEITYFVRPDMTGKGLGSKMLRLLEAAGKERGVTTILAGISSLNEESIRFHTQQGFRRAGGLSGSGQKKELFSIRSGCRSSSETI